MMKHLNSHHQHGSPPPMVIHFVLLIMLTAANRNIDYAVMYLHNVNMANRYLFFNDLLSEVVEKSGSIFHASAELLQTSILILIFVMMIVLLAMHIRRWNWTNGKQVKGPDVV